MTANLYDLPYFIMLSQSSMPLAGANPSAASLAHPIIQYHFADDNPHDILPRHDGESVIILDFDPGRSSPLVESASRNIAVTGIKVTDAPPSGTPIEGEPSRNNNMFIIETVCGQRDEEQSVATTSSDPRLALAQFRERNEILKQVLDSPSLGYKDEGLRNGDGRTNSI